MQIRGSLYVRSLDIGYCSTNQQNHSVHLTKGNWKLEFECCRTFLITFGFHNYHEYTPTALFELEYHASILNKDSKLLVVPLPFKDSRTLIMAHAQAQSAVRRAHDQMKAPSLQLLGGVQWFDSTFNHIAYRVAFRTPSYLLELVVIPWCLHKACISSCLHVKINPYYGIRRQFLADVACASVLAMRKKSEFPIASLTDAIFSACFSAVMTYK